MKNKFEKPETTVVKQQKSIQWMITLVALLLGIGAGCLIMHKHYMQQPLALEQTEKETGEAIPADKVTDTLIVCDTVTELEAMAAISAERMNILYAGVANKVTISANVAAEKLRVSWDKAKATALGGGRYEVSVQQEMVGQTIPVTVSADMGDGNYKKIGKKDFRVKSVPNPAACIGSGIDGGSYPRDLLLANPFIVAMTPKDFEYEQELLWNVLSYKICFYNDGIETAPIIVRGSRLPDNISRVIREASPGTQIEISDIKVQSSAGQRTLPALYVTISK